MPSSGFGKDARLSGKREFDRVFEEGRKLVGGDLILWSLKREGGARLGLSVSRKVGGAVRRNRIKRLLRESFRLNRHRMSGHDIIVYPRPGCAWKALRDAEASFVALCRRAGIVPGST